MMEQKVGLARNMDPVGGLGANAWDLDSPATLIDRVRDLATHKHPWVPGVVARPLFEEILRALEGQEKDVDTPSMAAVRDMPFPDADALDQIAGLLREQDQYGPDETLGLVSSIVQQTGRETSR